MIVMIQVEPELHKLKAERFDLRVGLFKLNKGRIHSTFVLSSFWKPVLVASEDNE